MSPYVYINTILFFFLLDTSCLKSLFIFWPHFSFFCFCLFLSLTKFVGGHIDCWKYAKSVHPEIVFDHSEKAKKIFLYLTHKFPKQASTSFFYDRKCYKVDASLENLVHFCFYAARRTAGQIQDTGVLTNNEKGWGNLFFFFCYYSL